LGIASSTLYGTRHVFKSIVNMRALVLPLCSTQSLRPRQWS
jgi:hypothetical protein